MAYTALFCCSILLHSYKQLSVCPVKGNCELRKKTAAGIPAAGFINAVTIVSKSEQWYNLSIKRIRSFLHLRRESVVPFELRSESNGKFQRIDLNVKGLRWSNKRDGMFCVRSKAVVNSI